jgi:hypothetical protein
MTRAAVLAASLASLAACSALRAGIAPVEPPNARALEAAVRDAPPVETQTPQAPSSFALPDDWSTMSLERFETWVQSALDGEKPVTIERASMRELKRAIAGFDLTAMRAAIVLARSRDPRAYEIMMEHLEARVVGPERPDDAADVIAAAAMGQVRNVTNLGTRLEDLVVGDKDRKLAPHPDLEVRVECACSLLEYKRTRGIGFLLRVLRDQTRAADDSKRDWTPTPHMAWAKSRAAFALSKFLATTDDFRPDGSIEHQEQEAARLEELWREKKRAMDRAAGK